MINVMRKVIGKKWFTTFLGSTGIVLVDDNGTKKAWIGQCGVMTSEQHDTQRVQEYGSKFPVELAIQMIIPEESKQTKLIEALKKVKELHKKHYKFHDIGQGFIEEADDVINEVLKTTSDVRK